jgi:pSer/pThr/pTyr-binding forkhead associated (FHA) protein
MAVLCLLNEEGRAAGQWLVGERPITVGRSPMADVKLEDAGVSRRHFMILQQGGDYVIRDLGSRNGTWVDGDRAYTAKLHHDDFIEAGRSRFRFDLHGSNRATDPDSPRGPHGTVVMPA